MAADYFRSGDYKAICDRCAFQFKASELQEEWDGLKVCRQCWDPKHPQEMIHPIADQNKLPWTRPEDPDVFVTFGKTGNFTVLAGASSATITDSNITSSSRLLVTGSVPTDPKGILGIITPSSGTAAITMIVPPLNDWTIYYVIVG